MSALRGAKGTGKDIRYQRDDDEADEDGEEIRATLSFLRRDFELSCGKTRVCTTQSGTH